MVGEQYVYAKYKLYGQDVLGRANNDVENMTNFTVVQSYIPSSAKFVIDSTANQPIMITGNKIVMIESKQEIVDENATSITFIGFANGSVVYYDQNKNYLLSRKGIY